MSSSDPVGILGGTFDPIHYGHLRLAEEAGELLGLGSVLCIPAGAPPLRAAPRTPASHRLTMLQLAIADNPRLRIDAGEVQSDLPSYTITTLRRLRQAHGPHRPLVLILGADAFARLESWHEWRALFELAHIAVATRPGYSAIVSPGQTALAAEFNARSADLDAISRAPAGCVVPFAITPLAISATDIRRQLAGGRSVRYLLPPQVLDYIHHHNLYH